MKKASILTSLVIAVVVLLASLGIGLCIREIRFRQAGVETKSEKIQKLGDVNESKQERVQGRPGPGPGGRDTQSALSPEERARLVEQREGMREQFENMSEQEREQFRAQVREKFGGRRREGGFLNLSEEERTKFREEMEKIRERWEEMSEEERQEAMAQMRERFGFTPRIGPGGRPGARRRENN